MNEIMTTVFGLAGGLAMFLFGMNSMSDALQKAAGERMKQILSFLTKNPIMGALAGALVTAVLQSSSATTVMVIGFVSAGLMTLPIISMPSNNRPNEKMTMPMFFAFSLLAIKYTRKPIKIIG